MPLVSGITGREDHGRVHGETELDQVALVAEEELSRVRPAARMAPPQSDASGSLAAYTPEKSTCSRSVLSHTLAMVNDDTGAGAGSTFEVRRGHGDLSCIVTLGRVRLLAQVPYAANTSQQFWQHPRPTQSTDGTQVSRLCNVWTASGYAPLGKVPGTTRTCRARRCLATSCARCDIVISSFVPI